MAFLDMLARDGRILIDNFKLGDTAMSETKQEWITLSQAANHPDCKVSRQALWNMIQRGDVPSDCLEQRPYGKRTIHYIDAKCLASLEYRESGQRGRGKKNL